MERDVILFIVVFREDGFGRELVWDVCRVSFWFLRVFVIFVVFLFSIIFMFCGFYFIITFLYFLGFFRGFFEFFRRYVMISLGLVCIFLLGFWDLSVGYIL